MIPNLYLGYGCRTKHPFKIGCFKFQVAIYTYIYIIFIPLEVQPATIFYSLVDEKLTIFLGYWFIIIQKVHHLALMVGTTSRVSIHIYIYILRCTKPGGSSLAPCYEGILGTPSLRICLILSDVRRVHTLQCGVIDKYMMYNGEKEIAIAF